MAVHKVRRGALSLLTVREVLNAGLGDHSDGGGLTLNVRANSVTWVLRYSSPNGKRREMGLGPVMRTDSATVGRSLTMARAAATEARLLVRRGIDPIDARDAAAESLRVQISVKKVATTTAAITLARAARAYHERVIEPRRVDKHAAQ